MLRSIPGASGLQIDYGLFLWLSSDVGNLLQVLDVPCMGYGELALSMAVVAMDEGEAHGHGYGR